MLQLSLCVNGINNDLLNDFKQNLKEYVLAKSGVFSVFEKDDFLYYLIVLNLDDTQDSEMFIKQKIAQLIINSFKCNLVENNLKYEFSRDYKYLALVQALINFDSACDESYIIQKLDLSSGELYIQFFYYFCCKILKEKWAQLIEITNQNSHLFNVQENYLDVLRFLLDGIDKKASINVEAQNNKLKVQRADEIILFNSYSELIAYIIKNNTQSIELKNVDKSFADFVKQLFLTRVTLCL